MVFVLFFSWWYRSGWKSAFSNIPKRTGILIQDMSLNILLKTLFSPWKQIISYTGQGSTIQDKLMAMLDNLIARVVGFFVRLSVLLVGGQLIILVSVSSLVLALIWPAIPLLSLVLIYLGLIT